MFFAFPADEAIPSSLIAWRLLRRERRKSTGAHSSQRHITSLLREAYSKGTDSTGRIPCPSLLWLLWDVQMLAKAPCLTAWLRNAWQLWTTCPELPAIAWWLRPSGAG